MVDLEGERLGVKDEEFCCLGSLVLSWNHYIWLLRVESGLQWLAEWMNGTLLSWRRLMWGKQWCGSGEGKRLKGRRRKFFRRQEPHLCLYISSNSSGEMERKMKDIRKVDNWWNNLAGNGIRNPGDGVSTGKEQDTCEK